MLSLLLLAAYSQEKGAYVTYIGNPEDPATRLSYTMWEDKMPNPKLSPKLFGDPPQPFMFEWLVRGDGKVGDGYQPRFAVFAQERRASGDKAALVVRQLLRLWEFNVNVLDSDHKKMYANGIVYMFLCWGGSPGGEQLFDTETVTTQSGSKVDVKLNTMYIYDLPSFKDPVEMAREVAHEYGHATLPPMGGFKTPEDWGNGFLGERLYMRYLRNQMRAKKFEPADAMGATLDQMDKWVKQKVDPLEKQVATTGIEVGLLDGEGEGAMNHYIGVNLLLQAILPPRVYVATTRDSGSTAAKDFAGGIIRTIENWPSGIVLAIPQEYKKGLWVPVGKCRVSGATVQKRKSDWQYIVPGASVVTLVPPKL